MNSVTYILSTLCPGGGVEAFCQNAISSLNAHGWLSNSKRADVRLTAYQKTVKKTRFLHCCANIPA